MYVHALIQEGTDNAAFTVPQQAVSRSARGDATVLGVEVNNTVALRVVDARRAIGDKWLIAGGLAAGTRVVVDGVQKVKPGDHVKPVTATDGCRTIRSPQMDISRKAGWCRLKYLARQLFTK